MNKKGNTMIPNFIEKLIKNQKGDYFRDSYKIELVQEALLKLNIKHHEEINAFFSTYNLSGVLSESSNVELLDLCSPTPQIFDATEFGRDVYDITEDYICLTSGEGEGFFLYSIEDKKVYDVNVEDLDALEAGKLEPRWNSFFDLMKWYLA